jgi:hypothetical protein
MLPLPLFMYRIVAERQSGMSSMIYQNGMRPFGYWMSNFLADFVLFYIVLIPVLVVGVRSQPPRNLHPTYPDRVYSRRLLYRL